MRMPKNPKPLSELVASYEPSAVMRITDIERPALQPNIALFIRAGGGSTLALGDAPLVRGFRDEVNHGPT